jgi:membrane associated rhomboid family serine protease
MSDNRQGWQGITEELATHAQILGLLIGLMWLLEVLNLSIFRNSLEQFGIVPRSWIGLRGILFSPFLHANLLHLLANTVPFLVLGWLVMVGGIRDFCVVSLFSIGVSGAGVWLFAAANTVTVGASGVIFGYLGYLLSRGWFERRVGSLLISLIILFFYGGLIWGVLPLVPGVSWQGHLFGFLGGIMAARYLAKTAKTNRNASDLF